MSTPHESWMRRALQLAREAADAGEVPVGAVLVRGRDMLAEARNEVEQRRDATAHAEVLALQAGAAALGDWRLADCTLYVTKEPCLMCAGACVNARLGRLVYGVGDARSGAAGGALDLTGFAGNLHRVPVTAGVLGDDCRGLLQAFFASRRASAEDAPELLVPVPVGPRPFPAAAFPTAGGSYVLVLLLPAARRLTVGRLGQFDFPAGHWCYVGSAHGSGGLRARLARHFAAAGQAHWHIDYLRPHCALREVWTWPGQRLESDLAEGLAGLPAATTPVPGFGASDSRRDSHLVHFPSPPSPIGPTPPAIWRAAETLGNR